jgi:hypothetical protein
MSQLEDALLLIRETKAALARGTRHFDAQGRLLETPLEILECLAREGKITFVPVDT